LRVIPQRVALFILKETVIACTACASTAGTGVQQAHVRASALQRAKQSHGYLEIASLACPPPVPAARCRQDRQAGKAPAFAMTQVEFLRRRRTPAEAIPTYSHEIACHFAPAGCRRGTRQPAKTPVSHVCLLHTCTCGTGAGSAGNDTNKKSRLCKLRDAIITHQFPQEFNPLK
jgi:hypothetical protein